MYKCVFFLPLFPGKEIQVCWVVRIPDYLPYCQNVIKSMHLTHHRRKGTLVVSSFFAVMEIKEENVLPKFSQSVCQCFPVCSQVYLYMRKLVSMIKQTEVNSLKWR